MASHIATNRTEAFRTAASIDTLMCVHYGQLLRRAAQQVATEPPQQRMEAGDLVHDAYVRLKSNEKIKWKESSHFLVVMNRTMRRVLAERARRAQRLKRGGHLHRIVFEDALHGHTPPMEDLVALKEAIARLEQQDPRQAKLVRLRFFTDLSLAETARSLGVSRATASRLWSQTRAWLREQLLDGDAEQLANTAMKIRLRRAGCGRRIDRGRISDASKRARAEPDNKSVN